MLVSMLEEVESDHVERFLGDVRAIFRRGFGRSVLLTELACVNHVLDVDGHPGPVKESCVLFGFFVSLVCGMEFLQYGFSGVLWRD